MMTSCSHPSGRRHISWGHNQHVTPCHPNNMDLLLANMPFTHTLCHIQYMSELGAEPNPTECPSTTHLHAYTSSIIITPYSSTVCQTAPCVHNTVHSFYIHSLAFTIALGHQAHVIHIKSPEQMPGSLSYCAAHMITKESRHSAASSYSILTDQIRSLSIQVIYTVIMLHTQPLRLDPYQSRFSCMRPLYLTSILACNSIVLCYFIQFGQGYCYVCLHFFPLCVPPDRFTASTGLYLAYADISILSRYCLVHYFPLLASFPTLALPPLSGVASNDSCTRESILYQSL